MNQTALQEGSISKGIRVQNVNPGTQQNRQLSGRSLNPLQNQQQANPGKSGTEGYAPQFQNRQGDGKQQTQSEASANRLSYPFYKEKQSQ